MNFTRYITDRDLEGTISGQKPASLDRHFNTSYTCSSHINECDDKTAWMKEIKEGDVSTISQLLTCDLRISYTR